MNFNKDDEMFTENPYEELKALIQFAHAADKHIQSLSKNQKLLMNELNTIKTKLERIEEQQLFLEKMGFDLLELINEQKNPSPR